MAGDQKTARARACGPLLAAALAGCGGAPSEATVAPQGAPAEIEESMPESDSSATLDVISGQPTPILLDGKPIGTTPISGYKVEPGSHEVTFVDKARGDRTMVVTFEPGEARTVQSDPPPAPVQLQGEEKDKK